MANVERILERDPVGGSWGKMSRGIRVGRPLFLVSLYSFNVRRQGGSKAGVHCGMR